MVRMAATKTQTGKQQQCLFITMLHTVSRAANSFSRICCLMKRRTKSDFQAPAREMFYFGLRAFAAIV
jgi:hypothetical protein